MLTSTLSAVLKLSPSVRVSPRWEDLLVADSVDVVLVAGDDPTALEGAKQLAAAGKTARRWRL